MTRGASGPGREAVVVAVAMVAGVLVVAAGNASGPVPGTVPRWADLTIGALGCLTLLVRRRRPLGVAAAVVAASAVSVSVVGAVVAALFGLPLRDHRRAGVGFALGYVAMVPVYLLTQPAPRFPVWTDVVVRAVLGAAALGWGLYVREREEVIRHLDERAARLEAEQPARLAGARRAERDRIAREMHDVLAHRLSMISLHAGALELRPGAGPDVHDIARVIRSGAHEALEELRSVIGALRHDVGDEPERPQPGLGDIADLVDDARRCGNPVRFEDRLLTVPGPRPPGATGRVAYRVVQEALTNARKHAPGRVVDLVLEGSPGEGVRIDVSNVTSPGGGGMPGSGAGLVGVAERVELAGGRLQRTDDGGRFRLEVRLPWLR